jgi:DNA-binding response OmpR family regulator
MTSLRPILLVEDSLKDIELILAALKKKNFANEVIVARDGDEALDFFHRRGRFAARTELPIVVLLDLKMPRKDGLEVLAELKAHAEFKVVPVVMLTSSREEADLVRSYRLGVNGYIVKPVRFPEFVDAIKQTGNFWALINEPPPA